MSTLQLILFCTSTLLTEHSSFATTRKNKMEIVFTIQSTPHPYAYSFAYIHKDRAICPNWTNSQSTALKSGLTVCVGNLNLELGEDSQLVECWGYLPSEGWLPLKDQEVPTAEPGRILLHPNISLVPGVSVKLSGTEDWKTFRIEGTYWLKVVREAEEQSEFNVRIAEGFICGVSSGRINALWLFVNERT